MKKTVNTLLLAYLISCLPTHAEMIPNTLFGDNAVLQQGRRVPVWGTASEGERVTVSFGGQKVEAATKNGKWMAWLEPMKSSFTPQTMTISGSNTLTMTNILVGEVWLCGGQSNMERKFPQLVSTDPSQLPPVNLEKEIAAADLPAIRHILIPQVTSSNPLSTISTTWMICSPKSVTNFTAVGYFFARDLQKELNVPIGLINSSWGGSIAAAWSRHEALETNPALNPILTDYNKDVAAYPERLARYQADEPKIQARYTKALAEAKAKGQRPPNPPHPPGDPFKNVNSPSYMFNAMINPLIPHAIRGVIWYQGETDRLKADQYQKTFPALISDWRNLWSEGDFPFLYVQIAPCKMIGPEIREAQLLSLKRTTNTAMTVITDWGHPNNMHPIHKEPVGHRLSLAARALAYGEKIEYSGPLYKAAQINGNSITISFDHTGNGLVAKDGPLKGFLIAGSDKVFIPAQAEIKGESVVVSAPEVTTPVAVRYGWTNVPDVNLFNQAGLPASPFRTDDWETQTNAPAAAPIPSPQASPGK